MDSVARVWNQHKIRPSRNPNVPNGQPDLLYLFPELCGTHDMAYVVDNQDLEVCKQDCTFRKAIPCEDEDVYYLCTNIMAEFGMLAPMSVSECLVLYLDLRSNIHRAIHAV